MATNLLETLQGLVTPQLIASASSRLGESQGALSKGLGAAFPLLLGGLVQKADDPGLMAQLMSLLNSPANDPDVLVNPGRVLAGDTSTSGLRELAAKLMALIFGKQSSSVVGALAEYAGLTSSSASSLMTSASGLLAGVLGDRVRRDGIGAAGLMSLFNQQRDGVLRALPSGLSGLAGLGALRELGGRASAVTRDVSPPSSSWLWPLAAALVIALGVWSWWGRSATPKLTDTVLVAQDASRHAARAVADTAHDGQIALAKLGTFTTRHLRTNVDLSVPERGVESSVIAYLDDPSKPLDPPVWFNFDRLLFETGSATLKPESHEQLKNVAEILKAYPAVKIRIGGYTDNTGDPTANLRLSQDRATNVRNAIVALGVAPDRLGAEGYGEQFPVADNATADGRQQNRRIAMRVTER